jgi:putative chitinase
MVLLTPDKLRSIAPEAPSGRPEQLAPQLNRTMVEYSINTPLRQAHFLAQVAHESDCFNALEEYASGEEYEYRDDLGNTQPGDGVRFKGRGLIQITGRTNYADCSKAMGVDLISNPRRLADPDLASRSAGWFWSTRQLNGDADRDDVRTVTRVINGGYNGLDDRIQLLKAAKSVLGIG